MEVRSSVSCSHKAWRRIAKRERRRRLRCKAAKEREADEERLRAALERTAEYLNWCKEKEQREKEEEELEKREHEEREKLWLAEEVKAQKEWHILQERKARARQQQLEQEEKIRKEFEAKQEIIRKKEEEEKRKREEEIKQRELLQKEIDDYIDEGIKTPEALRKTIDSQPGKELCPFFSKTGACRYGDTCSRNHRRVCLSKILLIPNFYSHFSLEKNTTEYDTDIALEFENSETRQHFCEFYNDVVPELEFLGRIKTLKLCCNTEIHLRGNLYVEYCTEREAAKALRKLKGRWYAGRQLNCEFANLKSWRSAVCGMLKCPKGRACNFLHTFKNPHAEYDIKSPPRYSKAVGSESNSKRSEQRNRSTWEEYIYDETDESRNWRWSESPEIETPEKRLRNSEKQYRHTNEKNGHRSSRYDKKQDRSSRSSRRFKKTSTERKNHHSSSIRSRRCYEKKHDNDDFHKNKRSFKKYSNEIKREYDNSDESYERMKTISKKCKYSRTYSTVGNQDDENTKSKSRQSEEHDDFNFSSLKTENDINRLTSENKDNDVKKRKKEPKSKWDSKNFDDTSLESVNSSDSDSSSDNSELRRTINKRSPDGWTTTDSDNEEDNKRFAIKIRS
ncbi:U2 small nuclear ribonucleoprotein auxiliary factor 35 kDa subunit-related protein 1 isoform X2 [Vespa velutina]|uniref:U2 small nuclear ribonucleoprotein auxiliary factor 35 kDa subunit-related protein 1 isoform X2 n=1 Tax=Vespa velutina TaxID=202808 RepID=UPI001FB522F1|nr:U2 small nuclear ribonucleoprotein auxiliary factor 35 kDa subunit-related protein 1 isoform X2 [Vespa velutina]